MQIVTVLPHLGLGDQIIVSGMIKARFGKEPVRIIGRYEHEPSLKDLYRDRPNFNVIPALDDETAYEFFGKQKPDLRIGLGQWCEHTTFDASQFVQEFARQLNVDVETSWTHFGYTPDFVMQFEHPDFTRHAFLHDDSDRGYKINVDLIKGVESCVISVSGLRGFDSIFSIAPAVFEAQQIHVIDSCFCNWIDREAKRNVPDKLFLHAYAKPNANLPLLKRKWTVLR